MRNEPLPREAPILSLDRISKRFNGLSVLEGVSFEVGRGEIVGLVGPNGSGKTTTINMISGVLACDGGSIAFDGAPVHKLAPYRRARMGINRTFQVPKPFGELSVRENVLIASHFGSRNSTDPDAVLDEVGLAALARKRADTLTVNQQKLLDLGRALATAPKLLLIDEIGAGLNPAELTAMAAMLKRLAQRGIALIVVEHLLEFLNWITNRVIVLSAGQILFEGPLCAASHDPGVVAAFIGG